VTAFEIVLASAIIIAAFVQVVVLVLLYRSISQLANRIQHVADIVEPQLHGIADSVQAVRKVTEATAGDVRASLAAVRAATSELSAMAREQGDEIRDTIHRANQLVRRQIDQTEEIVDRVRDRVAVVGGTVDRTVVEPMRVALAVATGVRRAVGVFLTPRAQGRQDRANGGPERTAP
jgi:hypothetical protein